jgi:ubiquinone biosynthesis protein UbiJ
VALFSKKEEDRLVAARGDLDAAQRKLATLLARENVAATSADRWSQWTAECDATAAEVARLTALVSKLEADAEAARA